MAGDVLQPRLAQRGDGFIDQRGVADVAPLRDENGAEACLQVRQPCARFVLVGEAVDETGLGGDLQQQVGQVGVGEVPVDLVAQREQAGRFGQCVELLDGQASVGELVYRVFGVQALEGAPVGRVELGAEPLAERLGRLGQRQ